MCKKCSYESNIKDILKWYATKSCKYMIYCTNVAENLIMTGTIRDVFCYFSLNSRDFETKKDFLKQYP